VDDDEPVPKLPRGRGFKLSTPELVKILVTGGMLVAVVAMARPCGNAVSSFLMKFDNGSAQGSAAKSMPRPDTVKAPPAEPTEYELITPGMSDEERRAAIERAKARAAGSAKGAPAAETAGTAGTAGSGSAR